MIHNKWLIIKNLILAVAAIVASAFSFQNCSPAFKSASDSETFNFSSIGAREIDALTAAQRLEAAKTVLQSRCAGCHNETNPQLGKIVFDTDQAFVDNRFVVAGSLAASKIITRLALYPIKDGTQIMPPTNNLTQSEYATLTSWVEKMNLDTSGGSLSQNNFTCDSNEAPSFLDARRLSKQELYNTLFLMISRPFGDATANTLLSASVLTFWNRVPNDNRTPFSRADRSINSSHAQAYFDLAEEISNQMTQASRLLPLLSTYINYNPGACTNVDVNNLSTACRDAFIQNFLLRLWSRSVEVDNNNLNNELVAFQAEFAAGVSTAQSVNNFLFRSFLSPQYLNHLYLDVDNSSGQVNLSSLAVGRRLSFHFQLAGLSEPDLQMVLRSNLNTEQGFGFALNQIAANSDRMIRDFTDDWLRLHTIPDVTGGTTAKWNAISQGITFNNTLRDAMRQETFDFMSYLYNNNRPIKEILTSNVSLARDINLMRIYRQSQPAPTAATEQNAIRFPANERSGLTTRAAFLYNAGDTERPIHRGLMVMSQFLCSEPRGAPPAGASSTPLPTGVITIREKVIQQTASTSCVGCHSQINPAGFSLGNFNSFGMYQDMEPIYVNNTFIQNLQIDASVNIMTFLDLNTNVRNSAEMNEQMAISHRFRSCLPRYYYTYFHRLSNRVSENNSCQMRRMYQLMEADASVSDFFRSSVNEPNFRRRLIVK